MKSALSAIHPLTPTSPSWQKVKPMMPIDNGGYPYQMWVHPKTGLTVISAVEVADGITTNQAIPQYHISISLNLGGSNMPCRCSPEQAQWVIEQFGATDAIEDNHGPLIRSFWMPVAEKYRGVDCECKEDETAVVEPGGFEWRPLNKENYERGKS